MKTFIYAALTLTYFSISTNSTAQNSADFQYRRSSLSMILIESDDFPSKNAVMNSWNNFPFPDKYNKHLIETQSFPAGGVELSAQQYQVKISRAIEENDIAKQLVATWFNRDADGKFNTNLIQERGFYNATEMEASIAEGQARGRSSLGDAGEELLKNTFVTFSTFNFVENEPVARLVRDAAKESIASSMGGSSQLLVDAANKSADKVYEKTKEGYSLWSKTWLYALNWNDSIAAVFYNDLWANPSAFDESDLFTLNFIGIQENKSLVTFKLGETRTQDEIIDIVLVRNVDAAFAELQKDHDVFKPKVPVLSSDPISAQIGMKEGLTGGEKFDVLELVYDQKTQTTEYKVVGKATVDKNEVWDNRYNAGLDGESKSNKEENPRNATLFKGNKSILPGMLLIQKK